MQSGSATDAKAEEKKSPQESFSTNHSQKLRMRLEELVKKTPQDTKKDFQKRLMPTVRSQALQQVNYQMLMVLETPAGQKQEIESLDTNELLNNGTESKKVMRGVRLTYCQSWYMEGVTPGQLLHTVTLAPGESKRFATTYSVQRNIGRSQENVNESEALSNTEDSNNAFNEVTQSVLRETQSGFSNFSSHSNTSSRAGNISAGFLVFSASINSSSATTHMKSQGFTSSTGARNLAASINQRIMNSTHQHASSSRARRASSIKEVIASQDQSLITRSITNHNRRHCMTIQYYEVNQIYKVKLQLTQAEHCLFIPFEKIIFTPQIIYQVRSILSAAAKLLDPEISEKILRLTLPPTARHEEELKAATEEIEKTEKLLLEEETKLSERIRNHDHALRESELLPLSITDKAQLAKIEAERLLEQKKAVNIIKAEKVRTVAKVEALKKMTQTNIPEADAILKHIEDNENYYNLAILRSLDIAQITTLLSSYQYKGSSLTTLVNPQPIAIIDNFLVFSFGVLSKSELAADSKLNAEDHPHNHKLLTELHEKGLNSTMIPEQTICLPTNGMHCDGVLSHSISAEPVDLTRRWDWQATPVPIKPPKINPVTLSQPQPHLSAMPGHFAAANINASAPHVQPAPAQAAALQAIQQQALPDASGAAQAANIAQQNIQQASLNAQHASRQAALNLETQSMSNLAAARGVLTLVSMFAGGGAGGMAAGGKGGGSLTSQGGLFNYAEKLDKKKKKKSQRSNSNSLSPDAETNSHEKPSGTLV